MLIKMNENIFTTTKIALALYIDCVWHGTFFVVINGVNLLPFSFKTLKQMIEKELLLLF